MITCPVIWCRNIFPSFQMVLQHLRHDHRTSIFQNGLLCKFENCFKEITSYNSYRMHILRYHRLADSVQNASTSSRNSENLIDNTIDMPTTSFADMPTTSVQIDDNDENHFQQFEKQFFELYMLCREKYLLPTTVLNSIMNKLVQLFSLFECRNPSMNNSLGLSHDNNLSMNDIEMLWINIQKHSYYSSFCRSAGLVQPRTIKLDASDSYQYIPLFSTLQNYISHSDVMISIKENESATSNTSPILRNCAQGTYFKKNTFYQGNEELLRLHFYVDDLEICNPLGSCRTVYKLTCFYFLVANVETKFWSSLRNIHPVLIVQSSLVKKYGYETVVQPLINDLKTLETEGVIITFHTGLTKKYHGGIFAISADNLGAHDVGGFRRCFSSGRLCRFCMCSYRDIFQKTHESMFEMRTQQNHDLHVQRVTAEPGLTSEYGVRGSSCFNLLSSFQTIGSLPSDMMHDLLEGVIPMVMKLTIEIFLKETHMTKESFQETIQQFKFEKNDIKNKPDAWINGTNYSLSASQSMCLFYVFPFIIDKFVPQNAKAWKLYLLLSKICDIVFAPAISPSWISYLDGLIHEFYSLLLELAPNEVIPKCHFLLHYPSQILQLGPLRHFWCMRFEAYHQRVKKIVRRSHNFKNIAFTVANRIQHLKCWEQYDPEFCLSNLPELTGDKMIPLLNLPTPLTNKLLEIDSNLEQVVTVKEIFLNCEHYKLGDIHILAVEDEIYVFLKIEFIIKVETLWYMCGKLLFSDMFSERLHSYSVSSTDLWQCLELGQQLSAHPLSMYCYENGSFIRLRYLIPSDSC